MFKPLGLLQKIPCPHGDPAHCENSKSRCPFNHAPPSPPLAKTTQAQVARLGPSQASVRSNLHPASATTTKRAAPGPSPPPATKKQRNAYASSSRSPAAPASQGDGWSNVALKPPSIGFNKHPASSQIALSARQGALKTLYSAFNAAYAAFLTSPHSAVRSAAQRLAHDNALQQELDVFSKASKLTYKSSSISVLVGLKKRDMKIIEEYAEKARVAALNAGDEGGQAEKVVMAILQECTETGTSREVMAKKTEAEGKAKGKLSTERLVNAGFLCPKGDLERFEFMAEIPSEWGQGGTQPDSVGETKDCQRCGKPFTVGGKMSEDGTERIPQDQKACRYHWGKKRFERLPGSKGKVQMWLCCGKSVTSTALGEASCTFGPHVFKEESVQDLHRREAFITTKELTESLNGETAGHADIVALDCELCFTTAGMSLTRLTLISEDGSVILDELVRSRADVVDYNTRFSGIQPDEYEQKALLDLEGVRRAMGRFVGEKTILIGHGLENDLRALRLVHTVIVDTALLFQHPKGPPFKLSLKDLTSRHLGKIIQSSGASVGHSSAEDARMALELVRWKILNQPQSPFGVASAPAPQETEKKAGVSVL